MRAFPEILVSLLAVTMLVACAARAPVHKLPQVDPGQLPRALGCASHQVAFCAGTDCRPGDYYCVDRDHVLGAIWPGAGR